LLAKPTPRNLNIGSDRSAMFNKERDIPTLTAEHISPIIALVAGILILIVPRLLNYVVAIYLIVIGLIGLNGIYHFVN